MLRPVVLFAVAFLTAPQTASACDFCDDVYSMAVDPLGIRGLGESGVKIAEEMRVLSEELDENIGQRLEHARGIMLEGIDAANSAAKDRIDQVADRVEDLRKATFESLDRSIEKAQCAGMVVVGDVEQALLRIPFADGKERVHLAFAPEPPLILRILSWLRLRPHWRYAEIDLQRGLSPLRKLRLAEEMILEDIQENVSPTTSGAELALVYADMAVAFRYARCHADGSNDTALTEKYVEYSTLARHWYDGVDVGISSNPIYQFLNQKTN